MLSLFILFLQELEFFLARHPHLDADIPRLPAYEVAFGLIGYLIVGDLTSVDTASLQITLAPAAPIRSVALVMLFSRHVSVYRKNTLKPGLRENRE